MWDDLLRSLDDFLRFMLDDFLKFLRFLAEGFERAGVVTIFDVGWFLIAAFLCTEGNKRRKETGEVSVPGWILLIIGGVMILILASGVWVVLNQRP
jgi:hypothetical protein